MRRAATNLLLVLGSSALCGLALEASFRLFLPMAPLPTSAKELPRVAIRPHFEPSIFGQNVIAQSEHVVEAWSGARYPISAQGYRGSGFEWMKRDGVIRIAVYGGSAAFDVGRSDSDDWPTHAGRLLQEALDRPIEVINAAVPGHASFDNLGGFLAEGHRLGADYVLLYQGWNDLKYFRDARPILRQYRPYRVDADPLARSSGPLDARLAEYSHVYRFARLRWLAWNQLGSAEGRRATHELTNVFEPAQVQQFELIVATFADLVRNSGAEPILITEARLPTPTSSAAERKRVRYDFVGLEHDALVAALSAVEDATRRVASAKQLPLIDAQAAIGGVDAYFMDHVHLTPSGSDALASLVAAQLGRILESAPSRGGRPAPEIRTASDRIRP